MYIEYRYIVSSVPTYRIYLIEIYKFKIVVSINFKP